MSDVCVNNGSCAEYSFELRRADNLWVCAGCHHPSQLFLENRKGGGIGLQIGRVITELPPELKPKAKGEKKKKTGRRRNWNSNNGPVTTITPYPEECVYNVLWRDTMTGKHHAQFGYGGGIGSCYDDSLKRLMEKLHRVDFDHFEFKDSVLIKRQIKSENGKLF